MKNIRKNQKLTVFMKDKQWNCIVVVDTVKTLKRRKIHMHRYRHCPFLKKEFEANFSKQFKFGCCRKKDIYWRIILSQGMKFNNVSPEYDLTSEIMCCTYINEKWINHEKRGQRALTRATEPCQECLSQERHFSKRWEEIVQHLCFTVNSTGLH